MFGLFSGSDRQSASKAPNPQGAPDIDLRNEDKTHKFFTTNKYPLYYLSITKCGSTFLKNLLYQIDHDAVHPDAEHIHDHSHELLRAHETPRWMIRRSRNAFAVLRDPVDRFLSMYFDKIYGEGSQNFPELRQEIAREAGLDLTPGLDVPQHRENAMAFLNWLEVNLAHDTIAPVNPHWRPQMARVSTLADYNLGFFTLDGLDWQMPQHFADMIPDLGDRMALVKSRNVSNYPVPKAEVASDEVKARVGQIYPDDTARYGRLASQWEKRRNRKAPLLILDNAPKMHVLSSHRYDLNAVVMAKSGCSYVRNLTYALDHGRVYADPANIDRDNVLLTTQKSAKDMADGVNFVTLRHPISRFFSLYFDKIWGQGDSSFAWVAEALSDNRRFRTGEALTIEEHHDNCCRLLGFLETRFDAAKPETLNPHWRPQYLRANQAADYGFYGVQLDDFSRQITKLANGRIRGLEAALALSTYRNHSTKPVSPDTIVSPWIVDRIETLYAEDVALYERVSIGWAVGKEPPRL